MRYVSTRGGAAPQRFTDILLEGLAPDGGLYVPAEFPSVDLASLRGLSYPELAANLLRHFADDVPDLEAIVRRTYTKEIFRSEEITPLKTLEPGLHLLGLSDGPSLAFKDVALQFIGNLFESVLQKKNSFLNVLGATSGDTGSAAEYALRGRKSIQVFMLSPRGRMSEFQAAQMYALQDANIHNLAVEGVFDQCQDVVKAVNADAAFKSRYRIGAVNSINWARVAAQVVYYFKGFFSATRSNSEEISFSVPSGNFGNIYAGYVARRMGLPIRRLILATNENDVLDEFFRTGAYRVRTGVTATSSPSMDISKASNFERYAYDLLGRDGKKTAALWKELEKRGQIRLGGHSGFASGKSTHADRLATIKSVYSKYGVIIDPHTADGVKVGLAHREAGVPLVCMETAQPAKFAATIREAIGLEPERPAAFRDIEKRPQRFAVVPPDAVAVKSHIEKHSR